jgi:y4mF family transcriptional regulator
MVKENILPYGTIDTPKSLGQYVRVKRKEQGVTQVEFASLCGVGTRFISDLENGKPTVELGKTLQVLKGLGLEVTINPRQWSKSGRTK